MACGIAGYYMSEFSGRYMYRQFNIQQFHFLPTQCIYVFCVDLRTNINYFMIVITLYYLYQQISIPILSLTQQHIYYSQLHVSAIIYNYEI